jgi:hypothetical protein
MQFCNAKFQAFERNYFSLRRKKRSPKRQKDRPCAWSEQIFKRRSSLLSAAYSGPTDRQKNKRARRSIFEPFLFKLCVSPASQIQNTLVLSKACFKENTVSRTTIRRSSWPRSPSSPACRGRFRQTLDAYCGSRCNKRVPRRPRSSAPCRRWSAACRRGRC